MRRSITVMLLVGSVVGCSSPQLATPGEVVVESVAAPVAPAQPECTAEQAAVDPTTSYDPLAALPSPGAMPPGSTMAEIANRGRMIVGVSGDTLQFGARNPITGQIEGFDIDMLKEVATAIFGDAADGRIEYKVMTYGERLPSLESGAVDLVAHTMTINCKRWLRIGFSATYYDAGQKVLVKKGSGFTAIEGLVGVGARVCAPAASTNIDELAKPEYDGLQVVERPDVTDCLVALQQGQADAITADDTVLVGLARQDPNVEVVGDKFTSEPYGLGAARQNVDLIQFVNGVLAQSIANGRWQELYAQWVGQPVPTPPTPVYGRPAP